MEIKRAGLSLSFNQDYSLFSMGTENGFQIFNTFPFNEGYDKILHGGIAKCELSYRSNYLALVGGGRVPKYDPKKVVIYNDAENSIEAEFKFTTKVLNVKIKKFLIFIICEKTIYSFNFQTNQNIDCLETPLNLKGLFAINGSPEKTIIAYPISYKGEENKVHVCIKNYKTHKSLPVAVLDDKISFIAMDYKGLLLAIANEKGTIVRIHNVANGTLMQECKRGKEKAEINYIAFDMNYKYIGVSSDRKTIHIWKLDSIIEKKKSDLNSQTKPQIKNEGLSHKKCLTTVGDKMTNLTLEDFDIKEIKGSKTDSSFAKVRIKEPNSIFCFRPDNKVIIINLSGKYYIYKIDKKGGDCELDKETGIKGLKVMKFE